MKVKSCNICGKEYPLDNFYSNGYSRGGVKKYKPPCKSCYGPKVSVDFNLKLKKILADLNVRYECALCGYNKNYAALCFHHLNPDEKDFSISELSKTKVITKEVINELEKCVVLCANCHAEEHFPHLNSA